jgi:signal transduction histidine kinase
LLAVLEEDRTATQASSEVIRLAGVRAMDAQRFESLGRLASGVAHDFNNLLGVIIGSAEFAAANAGTDPGATRVELQEINSAALRGAGLTRQLLAFARKQPIEPRPISPAASIRDLLPLLERVVGKSVTVQTALETDAVVVMDPTHLEQILINLAANARDAMQSGGSLTLGLRRDVLPSPRAVQDGQIEAGPYAVLDVIDTGEGMGDDVLRNVFDPFFTTKAERGGTGLGLATVHSAVRQAQGDVRVESTPGVGTRFEIWLPIFQSPLAKG